MHFQLRFEKSCSECQKSKQAFYDGQFKTKQLKAIVQPIPNDPEALYHAKTNFISLVLAKLLLPSAGDFACAKAVKISPCKRVRKDERE